MFTPISVGVFRPPFFIFIPCWCYLSSRLLSRAPLSFFVTLIILTVRVQARFEHQPLPSRSAQCCAVTGSKGPYFHSAAPLLTRCHFFHIACLESRTCFSTTRSRLPTFCFLPYWDSDSLSTSHVFGFLCRFPLLTWLL